MANTLPNINILFKQRAATFTQRGGVAILLLKDDTDKNFNTAEYKTLTDLELDEAKYTANNLQYIKDTLLGKPSKVVVVRVDVEKDVTDALDIVKNLYSTGWISLVSDVKADYDTLVSWIKTRRDTGKKTFKTVVYDPTTLPDHEGIVVLGNTKVTLKIILEDKKMDMNFAYLIRLYCIRGNRYWNNLYGYGKLKISFRARQYQCRNTVRQISVNK